MPPGRSITSDTLHQLELLRPERSDDRRRRFELGLRVSLGNTAAARVAHSQRGEVSKGGAMNATGVILGIVGLFAGWVLGLLSARRLGGPREPEDQAPMPTRYRQILVGYLLVI